MKLAMKLVSVIMAGIIVILAIDGFLTFRREVDFFESDVVGDMQLIGLALRGVVEDAWRLNGQKRALELLEDANLNESRIQLRWVWLDAERGGAYAPLISADDIQNSSISYRRDEGREYVTMYVPVQVEEGRPGALELSEDMSIVAERSRATLVRTSVLAGSMVLLGGILAILLGIRFVGQPLRRLTEVTRRIGAGDLNQTVEIQGHDEFDELSSAINEMCSQLAESQEQIGHEITARISALEQLRHEDRLRTVGRLAAGVAHELGTPLNVVSGRASLIGKGSLSESETIESASIIVEQSKRMTAIIQQLLDFARRAEPKKSLVDFYQMASKTLELMRPLAKKRNVELLQVGEEGHYVAHVDAAQIGQVLTNLVGNAIQAISNDGAVEVSVCRDVASPPEGHEQERGEFICIRVRDDGKGISPSDISHIFEPFFTTKEIGEGTGLGLSIAYGIVQEHGGWIDAASEPGAGSCFTMYLPEDTI